MLTLNDGRSELWQWDTGRTLAVDADCSQVHFSNKVFGRSIDVDVAAGVAIIPDILLQTDKDLNVWAFVGTSENGYTKISKTFAVNRRNKPADYVFTQTDQMTLQTIQSQIGDLTDLTTEAKDTLVDAINEAARTGGGGGGSTVELDTTLTKSGKAADAAAVGDRLSALSGEKVNMPKDESGAIQNGTDGQILQTNGDGTTQWVDKPSGGGGVSGDYIHAPATAEVGQTIVVKAVDENGKPTAWEAADMPSGGIDWQLVDSKTLPAENPVSELEWTGLDCDNLYFSATIGYGTNIACVGVYVNGVLTFKGWYQFQHVSANMTNTVLISKMPERYRTEAKGSYTQTTIYEQNFYETYEGKIDSIKFVFGDPFTQPISLFLYKG